MKSSASEPGLRFLSNTVEKLVKQKHRDYLLKIEDSLKENLKLCGSYHKAILHHRSDLASEITFDGRTTKTAAKKALLFNTYFCSVFTPPEEVRAPNLHSYPRGTIIKISEIRPSVSELRDCLTSLNISTATGPDGIPARILKECDVQIAPSLCHYSIVL